MPINGRTKPIHGRAMLADADSVSRCLQRVVVPLNTRLVGAAWCRCFGMSIRPPDAVLQSGCPVSFTDAVLRWGVSELLYWS